jgi:hypothetical protein
MENQSSANPAYRQTGKKKTVIDRKKAFDGLNNPKTASTTDQTPKAPGKRLAAAEVRRKAFDGLNNPKAPA